MRAAVTSVDTNVVVRLLTGDDPVQTAAARSLFASGPVWIGKTVLLEVAWVLESVYAFDKPGICGALNRLLGLDNAHTDDKASVVTAIAMASAGLDIADAIHLMDRPPDATFLTFDEKLIRRAKRTGITGVSRA